MRKDVETLPRLKKQQWKADFRRNYLQAHSKALEAEYEFIADQVHKVTKGRVKISKLQAAAIDPTRNREAWPHLYVDGVPMQEHYHFDAWRRPADSMVSLSTTVQKQIGYHQTTMMLDHLILYLKNMLIE